MHLRRRLQGVPQHKVVRGTRKAKPLTLHRTSAEALSSLSRNAPAQQRLQRVQQHAVMRKQKVLALPLQQLSHVLLAGLDLQCGKGYSHAEICGAKRSKL